MQTNPISAPSDLPYGVPDFEAANPTDVREALLEGMERENSLWQSIAEDQSPASTLNTVVPIDLGDAGLSRAATVFFTLLSSVGGKDWEDLYEELAPKFSAHSDNFWMNKALYDRYVTVAEGELDEETAWLVEDTIRTFELRGVQLGAEAQAELREYNTKIASLKATIEAKISEQLRTTGVGGYSLDDLDGLSEEQIATAVEAGKEKGAAWWLEAANFTQPPLISSLKDSSTRTRALEASLSRADRGERTSDTYALILELAQVRAARASLLGYKTHAHLVLEQETAPDPQAVKELLEQVAQAAKRKLESERPAYEAAAEAEGKPLGPEDWLYYEETKRKETLGLDTQELRPYLPLNQVIEDGVFYAANKAFGLTFRPRPDIRGWVEDTKTWQVYGANGRPIGLFMADFFARPGKNGGAWMSQIQDASGLAGTAPIVTNNANFTKPTDGSEALLSWDEVETCFHEFGHALHGLLSNTYYGKTSGTSVPRDFVELPSQLNEMWAYHPEVLANFARHYETGEPLPASAVQKLTRSKHFGQAFATIEYVQSALIDLAWHMETDQIPTDAEHIDQFELDVLAAAGADHDLVHPRYRSGYFAHTFAGGYDAAYYSYMWAEAMVAAVEQWLTEQVADDEYDVERSDQLVEHILSRGNSRPPLTSYEALVGGTPTGAAIIARRGLD